MIVRLRGLVLWVGAGLGVLALLAGLAVVLLGCGFLVFRSGSMGPSIPTGSLALTRSVPAAAIAPGDVVSVRAADGVRVTHRVVRATPHGDRATLVLRGDANNVPDAETYDVTRADRVVASVPDAGYLVAYLTTPAGLVVLVCAAGALLLLGGAADRHEPPAGPPGGRSEGRRGRRRGGRRGDASGSVGRTRARVGTTAVIAAVLVTGTAVAGTTAYFTDRASAATGTFSGATLSPPTGVACTGASPNAIIAWTAPTGPAPTGYRVTYTYSGTTASADLAAGTTQYRPPGAGVLGTRTYTVAVASLSGTNWVSGASSSASIKAAGLFGNTFSCP